MNLLDRMKVSIETMTIGEKFLGSIEVTLLGVGIVFLALAVLYIAIMGMQRVISKVNYKDNINISSDKTQKVDEEDETVDDTELVAVITAAIAASLHTSVHNIVVKNITRVEDQTPSWGIMGRIGQIRNKF